MAGPVVLLSLLGLHARVSCVDATTAEVVARLWSPFVIGGTGQRLEPYLTVREQAVSLEYVLDRDRLARGREVLVAASSWEVVLGRLAQDLNQQVLTRDGLPLAVHAGCVTDGTRTVAWPAASTVGKSTFTAACAAAGWSYVTDEGIVLVEGARLAPYPRPLGLCGVARDRYRTTASEEVADELLVPPADLAAVGVAERPSLTDVLLLERRPGVDGLVLEPVPRVEAVPVLLQRSFNAFRTQPEAVARMTALVGQLRVWRAVYQDAWTAAPLLRDRLAGSS